MSPSDTAVRAPIPMRIEVDPGRTLGKEDIRVTVFDNQDQQVHQGNGDQQIELPPGLYTVRIEFGSEWEDQIVRHAGAGSQISMSLPWRPSPVPIYGTSTAHEYYSETSRQISQKWQGGSSGIFLFIRVEAREVYRGEWLWENLYLLDENRERLLAFGSANGEENKEYGYYGASIPLPPGLYILQQQGPVPREMSIHVFQDWQTQVFVFYEQRPLIESATVLMSHYGAGFDPDDRQADAIDMALRGLQSDEETLPNQVINMMLYGKFDNPMLGLLAVHFLLRRDTVDTGILGMVLDNLNYLVPGSPDVAALALMAREQFGVNKDFGLPQGPPMLRPALEAVYDYSARPQYANLVPPGSLLEEIAARRYVDSAYATWKPFRRVRSAPGAVKDAHPVDVAPWLLEYLKKQKASAEATKKDINLQDYARKLNQPLRTVQTAWAILEGQD